MVTEVYYEIMPDGKRLSDFRGLSTDTKPTDNVSNGSSFFEIDTAKTSYYDATPSTGGWTDAS